MEAEDKNIAHAFLVAMYEDSNQNWTQMLQREANIFQSSSFLEQFRPMHLASKLQFDDVSIFEEICNFFKDELATPDKYGCFPLHYNILYANGKSTHLLLKYSPDNIAAKWVHISLLPSFRGENKQQSCMVEVDDLLSKMPRDFGTSALHLAVVELDSSNNLQALFQAYEERNTTLTSKNFKGNTFFTEFLSVRRKSASSSFINIIVRALEKDRTLLEICDGVYDEIPVFSLFRSPRASDWCEENVLVAALIRNTSLLTEKNVDRDSVLHVALRTLLYESNNVSKTKIITRIAQSIQKVKKLKHDLHLNQRNRTVLHELVEHLRILDLLSSEPMEREQTSATQQTANATNNKYAPLSTEDEDIADIIEHNERVTRVTDFLKITETLTYVAHKMFSGLALIPDGKGKACNELIESYTTEKTSSILDIAKYPPSAFFNQTTCNLRLDGSSPISTTSVVALFSTVLKQDFNEIKTVAKIRNQNGINRTMVEQQTISGSNPMFDREVIALEYLGLLLESGSWVDTIMEVKEFYVVMPRYGANVQELVDESFFADFEHVLFVVRRIIQSLACVHGKHVVHGHIDLAHIVSQMDSRSDFMYISFGRSFDIGDSIKSQSLAQELTYPPPEILEGNLTDEINLVAEPTFDIYALGCCFLSILVQKSSPITQLQRDTNESITDDQDIAGFDFVPPNQTEKVSDIIQWMKNDDAKMRPKSTEDIQDHYIFGGDKRLNDTIVTKLSKLDDFDLSEWNSAVKDPDARVRVHEQLMKSCRLLMSSPSKMILSSFNSISWAISHLFFIFFVYLVTHDKGNYLRNIVLKLPGFIF